MSSEPTRYIIQFKRFDDGNNWQILRNGLEVARTSKRAQAIRHIRPQIQARYNLYGERATLIVKFMHQTKQKTGVYYLKETWGVDED